MADGISDEVTVADSVFHDAKRWRDRALSSNPKDRTLRRGFHVGLAQLIIEYLSEHGQHETLVEDWQEIGNAAISIYTSTEGN